MPITSEPGRSVSSRLLDVLFAFQPGQASMNLADLVHRTGMPRATVRRLAMELVAAGALDYGEDKRFTVGLRLWQLGTLSPRTEALRSVAKPFMEDLYGALGQHIQLAVLDDREAVIIERLSSHHAVPVVSHVGGHLPLHCSGVGQVLLSHAEPSFVDAVLSGYLRKYTATTITDPRLLRRQLSDCRRTGVAVIRGELTPGVDSVSTRIMDASGTVRAALSVVIPAGAANLNAIVPTVIAGGLGVSRAFGWRPGVSPLPPAS